MRDGDKVLDHFDTLEEFEELLDLAGIQASTLWECDFVEDMRGRYEEFAENTYLSTRQIDTLQRIAEGD